MKKSIILIAAGLLAFTMNAQTWSPLIDGSTNGVSDPVSCMITHTYNVTSTSGLYIGHYNSTGAITRWDGTLTDVLSSVGPYDLASSSSNIYSTTSSILYKSGSGSTTTWTNIASGGQGQMAYLNNNLILAVSGSTSGNILRMPTSNTWTTVPTTYTTNGLGITEAKKYGSGIGTVYLSGRFNKNTAAIPYGFTTLNFSFFQAAFGPSITVGQTVHDFVMDVSGTYMYACVSGPNGNRGFLRFLAGSSTPVWDTIYQGAVGKCEIYDNKLYFTSPSSSVTTVVHVYDPSSPVSATNPSTIATAVQSGTVSASIIDMVVYNNELYIGGRFTSFTTMTGTVTANNVIKYNGIPVATSIRQVVEDKSVLVRSAYETIYVDCEKPAKVELFDLTGRLVYASFGQNHEINIGHGIFIVRSGDYVKKIGL